MKKEDVVFSPIGIVDLKGKDCQLISGSDHKWYRAIAIGKRQDDPSRNTIEWNVYGEIKPLTKAEFKAIFG